MKNKDDIRDQFSPLLDGELAPEERASLEAALSHDAALLRELDSLKRVDDLYRAMPAVSAPDDFEAVVRERIAPRRVAAVAAAAAPPPARQVARRRFAPMLAAAAVLVVCAGAIVYVIGGSANREQLARFDAETAPSAESKRSVSAAQAPVPSEADAVSLEGMFGERAKEEALSAAPESAPAPATPLPSDAPRDSAVGMPVQVADASNAAAGQPAPVELKQDASDSADRDERQLGDVEGGMPGTVMIAKPARPSSPSGLEPAPAPADPPAASAPVPPSAVAGSALREEESVPPPMPEIAAAAPAPEDSAVVELGTVGRTSAAVPMSEAPKPAKVKAAGKPDTTTIQRSIGARSFTLRGSVWYERGYADEATIALLRDSDVFRALVKDYANVEKLLVLKESVVFKAGDHWYKMPPERSSN